MDAIKIHPADNVAVALRDLKAGETVCGVTLCQDVPSGHKFALQSLSAGDNVIKYGFPTGHMTVAVPVGELVNHQNIHTNLEGLLDYRYEPSAEAVPSLSFGSDADFFMGYHRSDGQVGVRNQLWIIPTVGCVNGIVQTLAETFRAEIEDRAGSVDAVVAFAHNYGCSQLGEDHRNTQRILADMVHHPNCGGVLVVGLGCENNQLADLMQMVGPVDERRVRTMVVQSVEGDEIQVGLRLLRELHEECAGDQRERAPLSALRVGLKCGGSDGLSGITANPLLGVFSDWLTARGGTTVLTEVPEMFGAETILMNRCKDRDTFDKTVSLINDFKRYFMASGQPVYENPSPGNKAGGISTLEEKSLGCVQKSGSSSVMDVLGYGERIHTAGLNLLNAPGNDLVASTALAAAGCQLVLFTTGRGTPFGCFVPTLKVSTNSGLAARKPDWIDFNAGVLAEGNSMPDVASQFVNYVLRVAGGELLNNERKGYSEIAIFKSGITL